MDNNPPELTKVILSMDVCCADCQNKLERKLLKVEGVNRVATYVEENIVSVIGAMDTKSLMDRVAKVGKPVKLLSSDKYTKNKKSHFHENNHSTQRMGREHHGCSHEVRHEHKKEEEEHKCETYVLPTVDERVCRSYYCPDHQRLRRIDSRIPEENSTFFGGGLYSGGDGFCGGYPCEPYGYPQGYTNMPMYPRGGYPNMTQFGHSRPPSMRPFGFL